MLISLSWTSITALFSFVFLAIASIAPTTSLAEDWADHRRNFSTFAGELRKSESQGTGVLTISEFPRIVESQVVTIERSPVGHLSIRSSQPLGSDPYIARDLMPSGIDNPDSIGQKQIQ